MPAPVTTMITEGVIKVGILTPDTDVSCQVVNATVTPTTNEVSVPATWCAPEGSRPAKSSWTVEMQVLQDIAVASGIVQFLFENDAVQGKVEIAPLGDTVEPTITADVWFVASAIGGPAGENLTADLSLAVIGVPTVVWPTPGP